MMKKIFFVVVCFAILLSLNLVSSATLSTHSVCCEKTKQGAYCINTQEDRCDKSFKTSPTSCETTSYCKQGTCYDSEEGICMENTPKKICDAAGGAWDERTSAELPQCQLGCCVIVDQSALVPLVRCKRLATLYGVEINYKKDVKDEVSCIALGKAQDKGACVFEKDFEITCKFTTRGECRAKETLNVNPTNGSANVTLTEKRFYKDYLCSAEELNTECARQTTTKCDEGKVYWYDSCGNKENVYSSDKDLSWNNGKVLDASKICAPNSGNNKNCGNCDYMLGTRCDKFESGVLNFGSGPQYGEYFCKKNVCVDGDGNPRKNGESWCVYDGDIGEGRDSVGSRHFKVTCIDGEQVAEACSDYRNQRCIQDAVSTSQGEFSVAQCRINRWQDCLKQTSKNNCENRDVRDCMWSPTVKGLLVGEAQGTAPSGAVTQTGNGTAFTNPTANTNSGNIATGNAIFGIGKEEEKENKTETNRPTGVCLPYFPPGFKFWTKSDAQAICQMVNARCIVAYEKPLLWGDKKCIENCECLVKKWAEDANKICVAMGDCGGYVNWQGEYTSDGYNYWVDDAKKKIGTYSTSTERTIGKKGSGMTGGMAQSGLSDATGTTGKVISQGIVNEINNEVNK